MGTGSERSGRRGCTREISSSSMFRAMERLDAGRKNSTEEQRLLARVLNTRRRQSDQIEVRVQDKERLDREDHEAQVPVGGTRISTEAGGGDYRTFAPVVKPSAFRLMLAPTEC